MTIVFQIQYRTHPGQQMMIQGTPVGLGGGITEKAPVMSLQDAFSGTWAFTLEMDVVEDFSYRYFVKDDNFQTRLEEWGPDRIFHIHKNSGTFRMTTDRWRSPADPDYALFSSAFVNAILKPDKIYASPRMEKRPGKDELVISFKPAIPRVKPGHRVAVCGSADALGKWDEKQSFTLGNENFPYWTGEVLLKTDDFPLSYKFVIQDENGQTLFWEKCPNRVVWLPEQQKPDYWELSDDSFDFPGSPWKGAGVAIPVFSLRRSRGYGTGEFSDIRLLVDWAVKTGLRMIQILPVNDTVAKHTWQDSYPYAAISVYALHPLYINIEQIGPLQSDINQKIIEAQGTYLHSLNKLDYEAVMKLKSRFFKLWFDENKKTFLRQPKFREFFQKNEAWLKPYAAFSYLRDLFNTPEFSRWNEYSCPTPELIERLTDETAAHYDEIAVHYFIQYHAYQQLQLAADYARSKGVVLKGDIPIGIYRNSVDAWLNPELYHLDRQAGAPPDDFSTIGQNWRFPTYNWEAMASDNYAWWQQRLRQLANHFDAFRIDHILGFFRIWEIPEEQTEGLMGYFNPSIPYTVEELQHQGIWFDEERLCHPYIREHFLFERFGDLTDYVKQSFLSEYAPGCFRLKEEYNTQRKIAEQLRMEPDTGQAQRHQNDRLIKGLNSLIAEVVFLEAPDADSKAFFPRNALHFTRSFQDLDNHQKYLIDKLYIDYFYHRNENFWRNIAMNRLPAIKKATNMLLCGEDLGMVPECVPSVMGELGILSLEVQRMPKNPKNRFGHPAHYPYLSVATPSSHDTSTIRGWWEENPETSQTFYNEILGNEGAAPYSCSPDIVRQIVVQHLYSPSMWAVFPIQDLLGLDANLRLEDPHAERINNPGNPNHYWRYRMHLNLEDVIKATTFNRMLYELICDSGRTAPY